MQNCSRECGTKPFYWLLLVVAYGLVNAKAKQKLNLDDTLFGLEIIQCAHVTHLFHKKFGSDLDLLVLKNAVNILFGGAENVKIWFVQILLFTYKLGTVSCTAGSFLCFSIKIERRQEYNITVSNEDKLKYPSLLVISKMRQKEKDKALANVDVHFSRSVTGSFGLTVQTVSPTATFFDSYLQQKKSWAKIQHKIKQNASFKQLEQFQAACRYCRVQSQDIHNIYTMHGFLMPHARVSMVNWDTLVFLSSVCRYKKIFFNQLISSSICLNGQSNQVGL